MQKQIAERLGEARQWLTTALDRNSVVVNGVKVVLSESVALDAYLHLSYLAFLMQNRTSLVSHQHLSGQDVEAIKYLRSHLNICIEQAREERSCAGCRQVCREEAPMLTCSGCSKVVRSVVHLPIPSLSLFQHLSSIQLPEVLHVILTPH